MAMRSDTPLSALGFDVTTFPGFYITAAGLEVIEATWGHILAVIAPSEGPALVPEKADSVYFVPCGLQVAPFVGVTRERAEKLGGALVGKQRSASHVTAARMIVVDLDGISPEQLAAIEARLVALGLTYLIYSSHSFGRVDKPGIRARLVLPIDSTLDGDAYKQAAQGLNLSLLDGLADPSGFALHQQQGTWSTAPERAHLAFRRVHKAGVLSAAAMIAAAPTPAALQIVRPSVSAGPLPLDAARINEALRWIDPNEYKLWVDVCAWLKAAHGEAAYPLWSAWGETASDESKAGNTGCYAPENIWAGISPRITAEQGAGALYRAAREAVVDVIRKEGAAETPDWYAPRAKAALVYFQRFHPRMYAEMIGVAA